MPELQGQTVVLVVPVETPGLMTAANYTRTAVLVVPVAHSPTLSVPAAVVALVASVIRQLMVLRVPMAWMVPAEAMAVPVATVAVLEAQGPIQPELEAQGARRVVAVAGVVSLAILVAIAPPFLRALRCYTDWASGTVAEGEVGELFKLGVDAFQDRFVVSVTDGQILGAAGVGVEIGFIGFCEVGVVGIQLSDVVDFL